jgi:2-iminobutanoate/2-iminopropanoate deaminase
MSIEIINAEASIGRPYVPGIVARGDLLFVSGQIPIRNGHLVEGSIEEQVETVFENIESILRHAGASLRDVVRCGVFVANLDDLPRVNAVYERAFDGWRPARTTVGATLPGYGVEIDCIAVIPSPKVGQHT